MSERLYRSYSEPKRTEISWEERWRGADRGLINCWEIGRELRIKKPDLAKLAEAGELPKLGWKGGIDPKTMIKERIGTLHYLAQWQGLRGEDLNIDLAEEPILVCTRTGAQVTFTGDIEKYRDA